MSMTQTMQDGRGSTEAPGVMHPGNGFCHHVAGESRLSAELSEGVAGAEGPRRVLVAEDDALTALSLAEGLSAMGLTVIGPAMSGAAALRMAERQRPDVALLDVRMPDVDGLSAADRLQNHIGVPCLVLTAYADAEFLARARRVGVFGYLLKPFHLPQVRVALDLAIARFRQMDALAGEVRNLAERVGELERSLADRKVIERAKGILMRSRNLTEEQAYLLLRATSRRLDRRMGDLAQIVIDTGLLPETREALAAARSG
jgi:response regulator NasT